MISITGLSARLAYFYKYKQAKDMKSNYQVLVVGGGTGGIMTAAQLRRKDKKISIAIIEPAKEHFYQPAWTLVGAGIFDFEKTRRSESSLIPKGVDWIQDHVTVFTPEANKVSTKNSGDITYDVLIISAGIQMDLDAMHRLHMPAQSKMTAMQSEFTTRVIARLLLNGFVKHAPNASVVSPAYPVNNYNVDP